MKVKKGFVWFLAFVFISFLTGCGGSDCNNAGGFYAPTSVAKGTLSGVVTFGANPVEGALVALSGPKAITEFTTLADGKFLFSNLNFGEYDLTVTKSGFHLYTTTVKITEGGGSSLTLSCPLSNINFLYGGSEDDWIDPSSNMAVASDGTLWIAAATKSSDGDLDSAGHNGDFDGWLLHVDPSKIGTDSILLSKCFGGTQQDGFTGIEIASDGTLWLIGRAASNDGDLSGITTKGDQDAWLLHVDASGNIISNALFGGSNYDALAKLCLASDGTLWLGGLTKSDDVDLQGKGYHVGEPDSREYDACLFHIASDGETIISAKCFGGTAKELEVCGISENADGTIFFAIDTLSTNGDLDSAGHHGGLEVCLFCIASDGETIISKKCFGGSGRDYAYSFEKAQDGSLWFAGFSTSNNDDVPENKGSMDAWLFNVASDGTTLQSSRTFGGSEDETFSDITIMNDGSLWAVGDTLSIDKDLDAAGNHGDLDAWVIHMLPDGTLDYNKCFGGTAKDYGQSLCYSSGTLRLGFLPNSNDGDIAGAGLQNHGEQDLWITNIDVTNY